MRLPAGIVIGHALDDAASCRHLLFEFGKQLFGNAHVGSPGCLSITSLVCVSAQKYAACGFTIRIQEEATRERALVNLLERHPEKWAPVRAVRRIFANLVPAALLVEVDPVADLPAAGLHPPDEGAVFHAAFVHAGSAPRHLRVE